MSWIRGLARRWQERLQSRQLDAELDEELRDHLAREVERQLASGEAPEPAARQARLRAGSIEAARDYVRDERSGRLIGELVRDLRVAARGMRRERGFTAAVLVSLALGIAGTSSIFSVVNALLIRALPYPDADRLHVVRVWWNDFSASLSPADFLSLREQSRNVAEIGAYFLPDNGFALATAEGPRVVEGAFVSDELTRVLGVPLQRGAGFSANPTSSEVLVSDAFWRERLGGRADAIGRTLTLDGEACTVVGIMPDGFNVPGQHSGAIWVRPVLRQPTRRGPFFITAIARLKPGVTRDVAEERLTSAVVPVMRQRYAVADRWRYGLRSLKDVLFGDVRETLLLTLAAVTLVLAIAVVNVANLLMARGATRVREFAVRASLGAGRGRLVRQLLAEAALFGAIGGALGLALAALLVRVAADQFAAVMPAMADVHVDVVTVVVTLSIGVAAGLVAGVVPVLRLKWGMLSQWLRDGGRTTGDGTGHGRVRKALVVTEIALTLTVLTGAALLVKSWINLNRTDPGFSTDGVLSFRLVLPDQPYENRDRLGAFTDSLQRELEALPGVAAVAFSAILPLHPETFSNNYHLEGAQSGLADTHGVAEWNVVNPDFFKTMGIPLLKGRGFAAVDRAGAPRVALVNQTFARRHYPGGDPIGRRLKGGDWDPAEEWTTIVGVVGDVPYEKGLWGGAGETVYTAFAQNRWMQSPFVLIRSSADPASLVPAVERVVASLDSRIPLRDVMTMGGRVQLATAPPRLRSALFSLFGALALAMAITGVYGVMAYHVTERRRETAIRRALGAPTPQVVGATLSAGLRLAGAGIALGAIGSLIATRTLTRLLYHVEPHDPAVLAGIAAMVAVTSVLACAVPAIRAARVDPAAVLRDE
jgi:predicted permease